MMPKLTLQTSLAKPVSPTPIHAPRPDKKTVDFLLKDVSPPRSPVLLGNKKELGKGDSSPNPTSFNPMPQRFETFNPLGDTDQKKSQKPLNLTMKTSEFLKKKEDKEQDNFQKDDLSNVDRRLTRNLSK